MIKRASEFDREVIPNFCGGEGDTVIETGIHGGDAKSKVCACCTVRLEKGCEVGIHDHPDDDEIYYVISGKGLYNDGDGKWVEVFPGDVTLCGNGGSHAMKNVEDEPLVFLAVVVGY